ncbi:MAG: TIGR00282 family metallophosphoesterase [bacterium]|nr:MAG: TIGR00282 family metallophosphoesterase [bacterium]
MRVLFIGDIISRTGRRVLGIGLPALREEFRVDLCIGNVENAAGIFGITKKVIDEIAGAGVDVMTSGNHVWDKREGIALLDSRDDILRPANYPPGVPGRGYLIRDVDDVRVCVVNLQGRTFMKPIDCPFRKADAILAELPSDINVILLDFHAEATSEKLAIGYYLDGRVSAVAGTHTHVQTADEHILDGGTGYISDIGMVGPSNSIIGVKKELVINRFLYGLPVRFDVAREEPFIDAFFVEVDEESGNAVTVERVHRVIEEAKSDDQC